MARTLLSSDSGPTLESPKGKIKCYAHGQLARGRHTIPVLYEFTEVDVSFDETPLPAARFLNQNVVDGDWNGLKKALTSSLTSGMFLDSQFYAAESKSSTGPPNTRPVYFCGTVGGGFTSKLMACESPTRIMCKLVADSSLQVLWDSRGGKRPINLQTGMTATSKTKSATKDAPRIATHVSSGS